MSIRLRIPKVWTDEQFGNTTGPRGRSPEKSDPNKPRKRCQNERATTICEGFQPTASTMRL